MKHILFVYNANSSLFAQITDYTHKLLSPETYQCNLCKLTYDNFGMKQDWKKFIQNLPYKISFLHKDEFVVRYSEYNMSGFPAVFEITNNRITQRISTEEINKQKTIQALEKLVEEKLA